MLNTRPSTSLDPDATYVISGGLGGLGQNIAHWLADRGARNLLLLSRSGLQTSKAQELVKQLRARDVQVMAPSCDISDPESLQRALDDCRSQMPPFKGCIQAAMVLRDALFEAMSHQAWQEALASKVQGSWNLHNQLPTGMDFFIMLSSVAGIFGMKGQANYAAGNTFQDALARYRVGQGEKATAVDLGVIGFTGAVVDDARLQKRVLSKSILTPITEPEVHALLDLYCNPNPSQSLSSSSSSRTGSALTCQTTVRICPNVNNAGPGEVVWLNKPMLREVFMQNGSGGSSNSNNKTSQIDNTNFAVVFDSAQSLTEARDAVIHGLTARLSKALTIPIAEIDADKPLHQYGVDSLVAVELRSWFAKELQADIAVFDILGSATITSVGQLATSKSKLAKEKTWSS